MQQLKLAIIEDVLEIRNGLADFFERQDEIESVMAVDSIELFFERLVVENKLPDIILCDIGLPGMNGIDGVKKIKAQNPGIDIIMLTVFNNSEKVFKAICAGATGYIVKNTPLSDIKNAILVVKDGGSYMSPSIARKVLEHFVPHKIDNSLLTQKERQIVIAMTEGMSYKMIADRMSISINTVRYHIKNIYHKLHVNSKSEIIGKFHKGEI